MIIVLDSEFDKLVAPTKLHCIVCRTLDNEVFVFDGNNLPNFKYFLRKVSVIVGHNLIDYDLPLISAFLGIEFDYTRIIDTLIVSRLVNYSIDGGHSVEAWAKRLKTRTQKVDVQDFSVYNDVIKKRCIDDTEIQLGIYKYLLKYINHPSFKKALRLEHSVQKICKDIQTNGYPFDISKAKELHSSLSSQLQELDAEIKQAFPPVRTLTETISPRLTKAGTIHAVDFRRLVQAGYDARQIRAGETYPIYETQEFNPGSIKQTIERLWDAGWKPIEKTKGHGAITAYSGSRSGLRETISEDKIERFEKYGWKLSEENLRTLPDDAPEGARKIVQRLLIASRISDLQEWLDLSVQASDGVTRVHGYFNGLGAWTHRLSTNKPNMQNIPVPQHISNPKPLDILSDQINEEMRRLWGPEPSKVLVGTDADGIQMRVFAHYINDERLTNALISGSKKDGTDIHSLHWQALGPDCKGRNPAKTFIYAWLLGAGVGKVSEILETESSRAKAAIDRFIEFYPGLSDLKQGRIPRDAKRGYFEGLDGRLVVCDNEHKMLAGYLQNGEAVIMKTATQIWVNRLRKEKVYFKLHTWPHDEWQTSAFRDEAEYVGQTQADAIRQAGEELNMNIPLAGQYKIGINWLETH